jgi:hypothetical protein
MAALLATATATAESQTLSRQAKDASPYKMEFMPFARQPKKKAQWKQERHGRR